MENIILFADDSRGIYIPQYFSQAIERKYVQGVSSEDWDILEAGPNSADTLDYWDVWCDVLNTAKVVKDNKEYSLYQDGDLFLIAYDDLTPQEKREMLDMEVYGRDEPASLLESVPAWIDGDITIGDVEAIQEGGCASGAYMPAVTYYQALETMNEHGDAVLDYIQESLGELPAPTDCESWAGISVHYLSVAVELWAGSIDPSDYDIEG